MRPATSRRAQWAAAALALLIGAAAPRSLPAEESPPPKAPVPPSPFLPVIYRYADAMLAKGRDDHGTVKSGLFLSILDRAAPGPLAARPRLPGGLKDEDRPGGASGPPAYANQEHDQNLLRVLYTLGELSGKPAYREAADGEIRWFLEDSAAEQGVFPAWPWAAWDAVRDGFVLHPSSRGSREPFRPWLLWDRAFDLAPEACARLAERFATGGGSAEAGGRSLREAGFRIRMLAVAHARTGDTRLLKAIEDLLGAIEAKGRADVPLASRLSLAIDCDGAAHRVPGPLASRLRAMAASEDDVFCGLRHDVAATGGFLTGVGENAGRTPLWETRIGSPTTAQVALLCVSRYENTGKVAYRELIHAAAEAYLASLPPDGLDAWPGTFGHAIGLQLAAWRSTAKQVFLDRARKFGDIALERFFDKSPLPRASLQSEHYETITGADTLALALVDLHLHILHITAVRCPPISADR